MSLKITPPQSRNPDHMRRSELAMACNAAARQEWETLQARLLD